MTRQTKSRAVIEALKKISKDLPGQKFNELRVVIALERAVARLERYPKLKMHLIFKGGFVLLKTKVLMGVCDLIALISWGILLRKSKKSRKFRGFTLMLGLGMN